MRFRNRADAGRRLASRLEGLRGKDAVILGLPRGGVPVAAEVARALAVPLDIILVRKLGVPNQPELGMGAIGESGARVINPDVVRYAQVSEAQMAEVERRERAELQRRALRFRGGAPHEPLVGRIAVIVDDGIATGSTARAACQVARAQGAATVLLAVPVAPLGADVAMRGDADEVICLEMPERFLAIGEWYEDFAQTSDEEVVALLRAARAMQAERAREHPADEPEEQVPEAVTGRQDEPGISAGAPGGHAPEPAAGGPGAGASRAELDGLVDMLPFAAGLGLVLDAAAPDEVRGRMPWAPERCTTGGILHGGVLMALADSLGGICAFLNLPPGALTATTSSATVFTRAVRSGEVTAVTRPLHVGRSTIVVQTDLTDDAGRRVAQ
ncbi:MAG TPA: hotdog fold thioesterase, partial [Streptosporangiaceae bacterium]|nr:hotdog fold thioesterase [Streptosporangiaceae bacterium]